MKVLENVKFFTRIILLHFQKLSLSTRRSPLAWKLITVALKSIIQNETKPEEQYKMQVDQEDGKQKDQTDAQNQATEESATSESKENASGNKQEQSSWQSKAKVKVKSIDLPILAKTLRQVERDHLNSFIENEGKMIMQYKLEKERNDAKNAVEEYVYDLRDKLCGIYEKFISEDDNSKLSLMLEDTENWLYEEGEDQPKQVYVDKLVELKKYERPKAFDDLGKKVQMFMKAVEAFKKNDERYDHLETEEMAKVEKCANEMQLGQQNEIEINNSGDNMIYAHEKNREMPE
uniref:Uncharacterized protein n=1 Tax=Erpetoichthys calabaricus TaxID=27687 RepID=A0A8C4XGP6_ERPCA